MDQPKAPRQGRPGGEAAAALFQEVHRRKGLMSNLGINDVGRQHLPAGKAQNPALDRAQQAWMSPVHSPS